MDEFGLEAVRHLRALTGRGDAVFRSGQLDAIRAAVEDRRRVLVVQRTGWGKSAVYFIATKMLRDRGLGPTLLLSPLIALMANQVEAASQMGLQAATLNSTNPEEWDQIRDELKGDRLDLLLISEMRLANESFRKKFLPYLGSRAGLLVVDEAHCISDWGHDFRPNYRRIGRMIQRLPVGTPVIGCTATANDRVVDDVKTQFGEATLTVRGSLAREGLRLEVHSDKRSPDTRLAWLAENVPRLKGTGIIYCLTRCTVMKVAEFLHEQGIRCGQYLGGGNEAEIAQKEASLDDFVHNRIDCMVATSALGMGYDKPDVGWVIHYQMPQSPIAYYQQVGRAGRALACSYGILFAGGEDRDIQNFFISQAFPTPEEVDSILKALEQSDDGLRKGQIAARVNIALNRVDNFLDQLQVEGVVDKDDDVWRRTLKRWTYPVERVEAVNAFRRQEQKAMEEYLRLATCRMAYLCRQLDDEEAGSCGICDVCRGERFGVEPTESLVVEADTALRYNHVEVKPRKQWPPGTEHAGRIPVESQHEPGWCLCPWGEAGWGPMVRHGKQKDGRFSDELVVAMAEMLSQKFDEAPTWLTFVPSKRTPLLVPDFARRLGKTLEIPVLDLLQKTRDTPPQKLMQNSAHQHANVRGAFERRSTPPSTPGFLFDDIIDSRWTITVISSLLHSDGSGPITPIALASAAKSG